MTAFYVTGVDDFVIANVFFNVGNKGDDVFFSLIEHAWDCEIFCLIIDPSRGS